MRKLTADDLDLLNLVLAKNPDLAAAVQAKAEALVAGLKDEGGGQVVAVSFNGKPPPTTGPLEDRIAAWFKAHPGKHPLGECRAALGVKDGDKAFKVAFAKAQKAGSVKGTGRRGRGAMFWAPEEKA